MNKILKEKLVNGSKMDPNLLISRDKVKDTFGHNPEYLENEIGLTKSDLIRLERAGLAFKARYDTQNCKRKAIVGYDKEGKELKVQITGTHRTRWVIFDEALK